MAGESGIDARRLRDVLGQILDRPIAAGEVVNDVIPELEHYVSERRIARNQAERTVQWQFGDVPELVAQVVTAEGHTVVARLAGGRGQVTGQTIEDDTARAYMRALLGLAGDYLDRTEPARATAARSDR